MPVELVLLLVELVGKLERELAGLMAEQLGPMPMVKQQLALVPILVLRLLPVLVVVVLPAVVLLPLLPILVLLLVPRRQKVDFHLLEHPTTIPRTST